MNKDQLRKEFDKEFIKETYDSYQGMTFDQLDRIAEWWLSKFDSHIQAIREAIEQHRKTNTYDANDRAVFMTTISEVLSLPLLNVEKK